MRTFFRAFKAISVFTLAFFSWTYLPLFQIAAYAATKQEKTIPTRTSRQSAGPPEKFEKLLEELRDKTRKAEEKSGKGEDSTSEIEAIKSRKSEIDALDTDLRKDFAATEKKLRDANLPKEILNRHSAFVKNYEDNLSELKANIDAIEKAKMPSALKAEVAKAKTHLEKVKPGKKHVPLNPNKLPHRIVKLKERAPRLKNEDFDNEDFDNEDFDKEFPRQRKKKSVGTASNDWLNGNNLNDHVKLSQKRVLLAVNDTLSDIPLLISPSPIMSAQKDDNSLLLAQATRNPPSQDDLSETPEIQFTPEIRAKAQELGFKPVKIYEWIRNNIDYQPYYGSFKGAQQTLLEGAGNDFDQASLLIAMLRVSQIEARYSYGTIELPVERVMNWVGGVTDPRMAGAILATKGIPVKLIIVGGVAKYFQLEHVWVEAWVNYIPSRGAVHRTGHGDTWIPLDASYKQFTYKQGMDMYSLMGFNAEDFLMSYITDTRARDITAYQAYGKRLVDFIDMNYPDATIDQVFGASEIKATKTIIKQEFPFLLGTLPYKTIAKAADFSEIPSTKDYTITIQIEDIASGGISGLSYSGNLSFLSDKRMTVSYEPATSADESLIARYGGNMLSVPPYLLSVKPILKISGTTVATGAPIGLGQDQNIIISFAGPDGDADRIQNIITSGNYSAIIIQSQDTPSDASSRNMAALIENSKKIYPSEVSLDDLLGEMLYSIGVMYFHNISIENGTYAKTLQLINSRQPCEAMVTHRVKVNYLFGLPVSAAEGGVNVDVDRNTNLVASSDQDDQRIKAFMILSGLSSSAWENRILEVFLDTPSVSSIRLLKLASEQGIPIETITNENINELLPQLQISAEVKADISNSVNAGKKVLISRSNVTYNQWYGVGYIVIDPVTGAAGYMISGGLAGSDTSQPSGILRQGQLPDSAVEIRALVLRIARAFTDTPYVWGGKTVDGFDCSGFVHEVFELAGPKLPEGTAAIQYNTCNDNKWLIPLDERLPGNIVWRSGLGHVGICGGTNTITWPPNASNSFTGETVVHASGRPCTGATACGTQTPCVGGNPACGTFRRVIESPLRLNPSPTDAFGAPADKVGTPR